MPKILIVEDDADIRRLLDIRLKASGYETGFAADAVTALGAVRREQPDLILLDLGLPGGDGFVVMERLKTITQLERIPVVVVSARDPGGSEERVRAAGAAAYVHKPIDFDELLAAVRRALGEADA